LDVRAAECAVAGSEEVVSRTGAAASEWLWPEEGCNQALAVRVDCAAEAQRVKEGESRCACQELHEECGAAELRVPGGEVKAKYHLCVSGPLGCVRDEDDGTPALMAAICLEDTVLSVGGALGPGPVGVDAPLFVIPEEGADLVCPGGRGGGVGGEAVPECGQDGAMEPRPAEVGYAAVAGVLRDVGGRDGEVLGGGLDGGAGCGVVLQHMYCIVVIFS